MSMEANPSTAQGDAQAETDRNLGRYLRRLARTERAAGHAIRGRLHIISTNLDLLKHDTSLENTRRHATTIATAYQSLLALIELLLRRVRLTDQTPEDFDFRKLVEEVLAFLEPFAADRNVRLDVSIPERSMPMRSAQDPLAHAIFDAIAMSIDAVERWGTVAVTVQHQESGALLKLARGPVTPPPNVQADAEPIPPRPDWSLVETIVSAAGGTLETSTSSGTQDWMETRIHLPRPSASPK